MWGVPGGNVGALFSWTSRTAALRRAYREIWPITDQTRRMSLAAPRRDETMECEVTQHGQWY